MRPTDNEVSNAPAEKRRNAIGAAAIAGAVLVVLAAVSGVTFLLLQPNDKPSYLVGVNIAGAEFGESVPGIAGQHYFYPDAATIDYFASKGMNTIRLPVLWERLQHQLGENVDEAEMQRLDAVVNHATAKKLQIIIDIHNYAKYYNVSIGTRSVSRDALGHLWAQIAARYKDNDYVIFNLMNEPVGLPTETWLEAANIAIAQIRKSGASNLILVPGNGWSSARDWASTKYGTPNSKIMQNVADPKNNYVYDVHQYFDHDFTGTHADCQSVDIGVQSLDEFTRWARQHKKQGFLGEFGAGANPLCTRTLENVLKFLADNRDVWTGWAYWAAGAYWNRDYYTNIQPLDGRDRPQMAVLEKFIAPDAPKRDQKK